MLSNKKSMNKMSSFCLNKKTESNGFYKVEKCVIVCKTKRIFILSDFCGKWSRIKLACMSFEGSTIAELPLSGCFVGSFAISWFRYVTYKHLNEKRKKNVYNE